MKLLLNRELQLLARNLFMLSRKKIGAGSFILGEFIGVTKQLHLQSFKTIGYSESVRSENDQRSPRTEQRQLLKVSFR